MDSDLIYLFKEFGVGVGVGVGPNPNPKSESIINYKILL